jgi:uncharacterized membrane protein YkvA (DUF1232 family)
MKLKERAAKRMADVPAVFLALKDRETPLPAKLLAALTVCYALSPVDLIPDFIPVLGYLDDLLIVPALAALTVKKIPPQVWARSKAADGGLWRDGKPKKWYYAVPAVLVWLVLLWLIAKAIWFRKK